jgi:hypothetical protein
LIIGSLILFRGGTLFGINPVPIAFTVVIVAFLVFVIAKEVGAHRRQASTRREEMHISILPKTSLGKWSVGLAIAFILSFFLAELLYGFNPSSNQVPGVVLAIIGFGIGGSAFVTGLISMLKHKERAVLVFVGMVITFWFGILGGVGYFFI